MACSPFKCHSSSASHRCPLGHEDVTLPLATGILGLRFPTGLHSEVPAHSSSLALPCFFSMTVLAPLGRLLLWRPPPVNLSIPVEDCCVLFNVFHHILSLAFSKCSKTAPGGGKTRKEHFDSVWRFHAGYWGRKTHQNSYPDRNPTNYGNDWPCKISPISATAVCKSWEQPTTYWLDLKPGVRGRTNEMPSGMKEAFSRDGEKRANKHEKY